MIYKFTVEVDADWFIADPDCPPPDKTTIGELVDLILEQGVKHLYEEDLNRGVDMSVKRNAE